MYWYHDPWRKREDKIFFHGNAAHCASLKAGAICNDSNFCLAFYIIHALWSYPSSRNKRSCRSSGPTALNTGVTRLRSSCLLQCTCTVNHIGTKLKGEEHELFLSFYLFNCYTFTVEIKRGIISENVFLCRIFFQ